MNLTVEAQFLIPKAMVSTTKNAIGFMDIDVCKKMCLLRSK